MADATVGDVLKMAIAIKRISQEGWVAAAVPYVSLISDVDFGKGVQVRGPPQSDCCHASCRPSL
jgi:hypothetical protein